MHGLVYVDDLCVCVCVCVDAASQRDLNFHVMLLLLLYACTTTWRVSFMSTAASQLLASPVSSPTSTTTTQGPCRSARLVSAPTHDAREHATFF